MAGKHHIDTAGFLWAEDGEQHSGPVATVAIVGGTDRTYSYAIPGSLVDRLTVGQRVRVPLGRRGRSVVGFCISKDDGVWESTLKSVESLVDDRSYVTPDLLELGQWIAKYYACPLGQTLAALVPEVVRRQRGSKRTRYVRLIATGEERQSGSTRLGAKQQAVVDFLKDHVEPVAVGHVTEETGASLTTIRSMVGRGLLGMDERREMPDAPSFDTPRAEPTFELNADQLAAFQRASALIDAGEFSAALLFGVSGSGKTEVYLRAMRRVVEAGRQVILLVPEIALTTQLVQRFASRFEGVAVIHSGMTGVNRSLTWEAIRRGDKRVIIGTRSAVFAPCPHLGLIVVDEEQEGSYKNLRSPRFHVRDVAIKRGQLLSIPVVLGSATPSLESWHNCQRFDHFHRIDLPRRVRDLPMPNVTIVDVNDEYKEGVGVPLLSHVLVRGLDACLSAGEQAVILVNRRGFASAIRCPRCGQRVRCPNCDVNMVYHAARDQCVCHYCHRRMPAPTICANPSCQAKLVRQGSGTQRVQGALEKLFPQARIARADSDTMRHERMYRQLVADFEARRIDCLIGTQMIAKGLDFPFVSFVGVIGADTSIGAPDFRSGERLFQLITQVAGRAGRAGTAGEVVIQASSDSPVLGWAVGHDYQSFAENELQLRKRTRMPPITRLTRFVVSDSDEKKAKESASVVATALQQSADMVAGRSIDVLGPMPCVLPRLRGQYRYEILLRCSTAGIMQSVLDAAGASQIRRICKCSAMVDVDPVSLV